MYLKRLSLTNFRNYEQLDLEPDQFFNVIYGPNAQGKTNILESIYFTCTGKSFRTPREIEIIRWESNFSSVNSLLETNSRQIEVRILLKPGKKIIEVNGVQTHGQPLGWPGVVLFTPDDLVMIKGSPQERRRFLDLEIGPFNPQYSHYLSLYNRVLSQRNNLLREIREKKIKSDALDVWNEQLCRHGAKLLFMRIELLKTLSPYFNNIHNDITGGTEKLELRYLSSLKLGGISTEEEIYHQFARELEAIKNEEIYRAQSLIGPHRDDLAVLINGMDARIYGSQGQQRTVVLSIKISLIMNWYKELDEHPVLLLDDVLFELDHSRQEELFKRIKGVVQTFVTSTGKNKQDFENIFSGRYFGVKSGKIITF